MDPRRRERGRTPTPRDDLKEVDDRGRANWGRLASTGKGAPAAGLHEHPGVEEQSRRTKRERMRMGGKRWRRKCRDWPTGKGFSEGQG